MHYLPTSTVYNHTHKIIKLFTCIKNNSESNGGSAPRFSSTTTTTSKKPKISVIIITHAGLALLQSVHFYSKTHTVNHTN